ncbi:MAG: magnesium transporter [Planctomycetes bacterium]|nr:magnesium transporter [Planctomycetota bacterium]
MLGQLVGPDVVEMITERQFSALRRSLTALPVPSVAEIFTDMDPKDVAIVFRILPREFAADVFEYMPFEAQEPLLKELGQEHVAAVLNQMDPDDRTSLLEELPGQVTQRLISLLSPEERRIATTLLGYPEDSVGRRMTPDYVAVRSDWTVGAVMDHIRQVGHDKETLNVIYVIDGQGRLVDDIRLRELVLADPATLLSEIMDNQVSYLDARQDQEEAVRMCQELDRVALPVVDSTGLLVGIVTVDDIMDVAEEEVTEDIQKMAAVQALDAPYFDVGLPSMIRKRGVWLSVLFIGEMLTATAMGYFEQEISRALVLVLFIPLIVSSGGNSGSQAASLIIRALAVGELRLRDWFRVMSREIFSGLGLGLILGAIAFVRIVLWPWRHEMYGEHYVMVGITVAGTLIGVVTFGTLAGSMLPIALKRLGLDPAVSSAPFVATLVDVAGIIIYFTIAAVILRGVLL